MENQKKIKGITVEIPKIRTMEEIKARGIEKDLKAYDIAKQISEFAKTNCEAKEIIDQVKNIFNWYQSKQIPEIFPYPITSSGLKIIMPGDDTPGKEDN